MGVRKPSLFAALLLLALAACSGSAPEQRSEWIIRSRVVFVSEDLRREMQALPLEAIRLWCPFVVGDLYGSANTGDFINARVNADYSFEIDLNRSHPDLLLSLQNTSLSIPQVKIVPAQARIARLVPMIMEADGIEQIGRTDWIDAQTRERLMLLYVDRAARIVGNVEGEQGSLRYDIATHAPGYIWVRERHEGDGGLTVTAPHRPTSVLLAVQLRASADTASGRMPKSTGR
jgi:hypothetical protein